MTDAQAFRRSARFLRNSFRDVASRGDHSVASAIRRLFDRAKDLEDQYERAQRRKEQS